MAQKLLTPYPTALGGISMKRITGLIAGVAAVAAISGVQAHATPAAPLLYQFDFTGTCAVGDCNQETQAPATARLTLQNYTLGNQINTDNFYSFTYNGTDIVSAFTITADDSNLSVSGAIADNLPAAEIVSIQGDVNNTTYTFMSGAEGDWSLSVASLSAPLDRGVNGTYAAPEPISLSLLGIGLLGTGAVRRRRRLG